MGRRVLHFGKCGWPLLSTLGIKDVIHVREVDAEITDKKWKEIDDKALSTMQLCLSDATLQEVLSETTAMGLWKKLDVYEEVFNKSVAVEVTPLHSSYG